MKKLFFAASGAALLLLLVVAGVFLWSNRPRYGATALLKVSAVQPTIAFTDLHLQDEDQRDIFQKTQLALLTSRFVLTPVLHDAEIVRLTSVRNAGEDPVDWLARALDVGFLDNTEILQVSLELANQDEARRLVDAVVKSYFENVVERERQTRRKAFDQLREVSTDLSDELRQKRAKYQRLARAFGASESEYTEVDRQITNQNLTLLSDERARVKADLFRTELTLEELEVHRQALRTKETHPEERRETLGSHGDRAAGGGRNLLVEAVRVTEPLSGDEDADDVGSDRGSAGDLLGAAKASVDGATKEKPVQDTAPDRRAGSEGTRSSSKTQQATPEANDPELQARVLDAREGLLQRRVTELNDEIQEVREALRRLAEVNVDLTMAASEIDQLEEIVVDLKLKLARWEIELAAPPRIQLIQSAESGVIEPL